MHIHRFAQQGAPAAPHHPLQLVPGASKAPVGAAWLALRTDAPAPVARHAGDCLVVAVHGTLELRAGDARQELSAGDAAVVHGAQACSARALRAGTHALTVWLAGAGAGGEPRIVPQRERDARATVEFNTRFRRLPLLPESAAIDWGSAIADIAPRDATAPHSHVDNESFVLLTGRGRMRIDDESCEVQAGDVVHLPSGSTHTLENLTADNMRFFCTWWTDMQQQSGSASIHQGKH